MDRDIVIFGDLHLVDIECNQRALRIYKDPRFSIDASFSTALKWVRSNSKGPLTLIINGDFIDFDLVFLDSDVDLATAKRKFDRIFRDHRAFFEALVRLLSEEQTWLVLIIGNHDVEFLLSGFRDYFLLRLSQLALDLGFEGFSKAEVKKRIAFEPWFHYERDVLYVEHGDRFDRYASSPRPLNLSVYPVGGLPLLSLGSLSNRFILKELPTFNPFMGEQVVHGLWGYLSHLFQYYLIPPYRLPYLYLKGAVRTFTEACHQRGQYLGIQNGGGDEIIDFGKEKGVQQAEILGLWALGKTSIILTSLFRTFHILWLDRVCIFFLFATALFTVLVISRSLTLSMIVLPVMVFLYWLYGLSWGKNEILEERKGMRCYAKQIGQILQTPLVVLSHSHSPEDVTFEGGCRYLNTGSWAPIFDDPRISRLWSKGRTFIHLQFRGGSIKARLIRWTLEGPVDFGDTE